jgi:L-aminopeptidase/D-esterase-like protein
MKGLTDIPGIKVGHASDYDNLTGVTAILCEQGAVAGGDIRGFATGTQEWDTLSPFHVTQQIHGICFAGGSAFGLEACSGVRRYLAGMGVGFKTSVANVPIVPGAILFDLPLGKPDRRPTREMGEAAAAAARDNAVEEGNVGAGTGATVGKVLGMKNAMKGGIGTFTVRVGGANSPVLVSALVAVNPLGDVVDPNTRTVIAGARKAPKSREFVNAAQMMLEGGRQNSSIPSNTTLAVVATNARLDKVGATRLAQLAHHGFVRAISPVHTMADGDIAIGLSLGNETAPTNALGIAAGEAVAQAIVRAVRAAKTLGGVPGLKDWAQSPG